MKLIKNATGTNVDLYVKSGRSNTFTVTVTGVEDWTGIEAVLYYALEEGGDAADVLEVTCTIDALTDIITIAFLPEHTQELTGDYYHELIIYDSANYLKDVIWGKLHIGDVVAYEII